MNPHQVTKDFETAVAKYTGAPYCVAVNSCSNALFLALMWLKRMGQLPPGVMLPARTYVSVPMQVMHAGAQVIFQDYEWHGRYRIWPTPVWDSARWFTSGMYERDQFICTSHHWSKTLGLQQAGCILHSNPEADKWLRRARFDGRTEGVTPASDDFDFAGWHMYLSPEIAALGLMRLSILPKHNDPLPNDNYPDLSLLPIFGGKPAKIVAEAAE